jgi:hypothetical protein
VLSAIARKSDSLKTTQATTNSPLLYINVLATSPLTITGLPSTSITFTTAPTGAVYLAYYNGTAWATIAGPGTLSGTTVTFGNTTFANPLTIATGASLFLAVYTGGVLVPATPTPGPSASATASASSSASPGASSSPSASPTPTYSPSPSPSPSATATATGTPGPNVVVDPGFEGATYSSTYSTASWGAPAAAPAAIPTGWYICQNMSELQTAPAAVASPGYIVMVQGINTGNQTNIIPSVENFNGSPYHSGSGAIMIGNDNAPASSPTPVAPGGTKGGFGICQDVTVPANATLTFWVNEGSGGTSGGTTSPTGGTNVFVNPIPVAGGSTFTTGSAQEAAILDPTAKTLKTGVYLFDELDGAQSNPASFVQPPSNVPSSTTIGLQTGWVQKGPYNLSALSGQNVTLYFGIWRNSAATTAFTYMLVDDVSLNGH